MKLIFCSECKDILSLKDEEKTCVCGKSMGKYIDKENIIYSGPCRVLGIANKSFVAALNYNQKNFNGKGIVFKTYVIPSNGKNIRRIENNLEDKNG